MILRYQKLTVPTFYVLLILTGMGHDSWSTFTSHIIITEQPCRVSQSVGLLTRKSEILGSIPGLATFVPPSADSRGAVVSYWQKYVHEVLVNRLGGLSLPRKSVVRSTDRPDMTLDVYRGRKTTTTQQQHH